jgi:hypothetical protein
MMLSMKAILRFNGAVKRDPAIDSWLNSEPRELRSIARQWFDEMRECGRDVRELMHDGCPTACVGDAPFAYVHTFAAHANIGFFNGAALEDPRRLLEGTGKRMRHVKLKLGADIDAAAVKSLIHDAYLVIKAESKVSL